MINKDYLKKVCQALRYFSLVSTTKAGSGHPTSCLSAIEIAGALFAGGFFRYKIHNPDFPLNDRFIISKGHIAPLLYSLWALAGAIEKSELLDLRKIDSPLEGHPTFRFPYSEAATGSLGQGLSIGAGIAEAVKLKIKTLKLKVEKLPRVYVLLGDSELAEGQVWEAFQWAGYRKIDNLIALIDVNRLGQRGETMLGWDLKALKKRISSFDWQTIVVEQGNDIEKVFDAYKKVTSSDFCGPKAVIFKTKKGAGISFLENKENWHGKPLDENQLEKALKELGRVDLEVKINLPEPEGEYKKEKVLLKNFSFSAPQEKKATRQAYGEALNLLFASGAKDIVALDAEVSNSTYSKDFAQKHPERFFEMFVAEQNMVSVAAGFARLGFVPFVSSFAAFLTRAFDQIRMAQYSRSNLKIIGAHAGVSIGEDGASQMGLEDLAMMRSILESKVFYPADYVSAVKLIKLAYETEGIVYVRLSRPKTPVIYPVNEEFELGGYKVFKSSKSSEVVIISAGVTLHKSLKAKEVLEKKGIGCKVIDLYCVKPVGKGLEKEFEGAKLALVVEDHYPYGGLYEAVKAAVSFSKIYSLAVKKLPRSGKSNELLEYEGISEKNIVEKAISILKN